MIVNVFVLLFRTRKSKFRIPVRTGPAIRIRGRVTAKALPDLQMSTSLELDLAEVRGEDKTKRTKEVEGAEARTATTRIRLTMMIRLTMRTRRTVPKKRLPKKRRMKMKQRMKKPSKKELESFRHQTPEVKLPTKVTVGSHLKILWKRHIRSSLRKFTWLHIKISSNI